SMVRARRWRASMALWICGNTSDVGDPVGSKTASVRRLLGSSIAVDGRRLRFCRHLTRRRPRGGHVAHLRQMDAQFLDDHPVHDAAARSHPLNSMVAVSPNVRLVRLFLRAAAFLGVLAARSSRQTRCAVEEIMKR